MANPIFPPVRVSMTSTSRRGMSLVEVLAVVGIIAVLVAILLPGLNMARKNGVWARSQSNLRQIHTYLASYATDHRETIVPAAFDYSAQATNPRVRVRTDSPPGAYPPIGLPRTGSWSDILWTVNSMGSGVDPNIPGAFNYRYDSPDRFFYENFPVDEKNVLRSHAIMTKTAEGSEALPFGDGAQRSEIGHPGYFAANEFFDVRPATPAYPDRGKWWVTGQIIRPSQSVYLVDNFGGEVTQTATVGVTPDDYQIDWIDYRYVGDVTMLLCLDGHIENQPEWDSLKELEEMHQIRFRSLDRRRPFWQ